MKFNAMKMIACSDSIENTYFGEIHMKEMELIRDI